MGFPIGCLTVATPEIANVVPGADDCDPSAGNPVACVDGEGGLIDLIEGGRPDSNCDVVGGYLRDGLLSCRRVCVHWGRARAGLMQGMELVVDREDQGTGDPVGRGDAGGGAGARAC